jgi:hypothetical protein
LRNSPNEFAKWIVVVDVTNKNRDQINAAVINLVSGPASPSAAISAAPPARSQGRRHCLRSAISDSGHRPRFQQADAMPHAMPVAASGKVTVFFGGPAAVIALSKLFFRLNRSRYSPPMR